MKSREQKLIDLCFTFAVMAKDHMKDKSHEEVAEWVAYNLAELGFHTRPVGSCWGVLYTPEPKQRTSGIEIIEPGRPD